MLCVGALCADTAGIYKSWFALVFCLPFALDFARHVENRGLLKKPGGDKNAHTNKT